MAPGREIRLRYAYIVRCEDVVRDEATGEIQEIRCTYDPDTKGGSAPDGRKIAGTIHWVSAAHAVPIEARLYDRLFDNPRPDRGKGGPDFKEFLNPDSLKVLTASRAEPSLLDFGPGSHVQFERQGFFYRDPAAAGDGPPVFNLTVGLRDTWERRSGDQPVSRQPKPDAAPKPDQAAAAAPRPLSSEEAVLRDSLVDRFELGVDTAEQLARDSEAAGFFEATVERHDNAASIANWIVNELRGEIRRSTDDRPRLSPEQLAELVAIVDSGQISNKIAKELLAEMLETGASPKSLVERHGLHQISDEDALATIVDRVLAEQADNVEAYRNGKTSLRGHFVGQVMKATGGRANPKLVQKILDEQLNR
jgi:glutaminyl-tRNA synthetase